MKIKELNGSRLNLNLKTCLNCGSNAWKILRTKEWVQVSCHNGPCELRHVAFGKTLEQAADRWNAIKEEKE